MNTPNPDTSSPTRAAARANVVGLYGIADATGSGTDPVRLAEQLVAGGCRLVQLRCKGWPAEATLEAALRVREITRTGGAAFVVNDDPVLAARVGADGLHIGQLDGPLGAARATFRGWIGRSTHSAEQVRTAVAEGADYVAFGPVFATGNVSRPKGVRGVDALASVRRLVPTTVPLVAIGGISPRNLTEVRAAGADAWAIIGAIATAADPEAATRALVVQGSM